MINQSLTSLWRNFDPLFFTTWLGCIEVRGQHSSHKHFSIQVWTLTGPLQHLDCFLFQPFCCRFAGVLEIIVLLHDPIPPSFSCWTNGLTFDFVEYRGNHCQLNDCKVLRSCGCKTSQYYAKRDCMSSLRICLNVLKRRCDEIQQTSGN